MHHARRKRRRRGIAPSHAIAALEARHETKLFDRIGRRIALTEAGRVFLMEARAILARAGAAELALSEFGTLKRGTLCVRASQTIAGYWLPRHLVAFQRAYPRLWIQRPSSERRRDLNPPIHALPSAHYEPLRHPRAPGLSLTGFRLVSRTPPWGFPYFVTCVAIEQYGVEKTEDRSLLAISRTVRKERGDQHSLKATGGTSDRDGGIAVRLLRTTYLVQLDALTNRVLFSLVTHSVPEDRRSRCGYSFAHLV